MKFLIQIVGFADGVKCPHAGQFVETFDFDAHNGRGYGTFTSDPAKALAFDDSVKALEFWRTVSKINPVRYDGKPNRPLTSTTIRMFRVGVDEVKLDPAITGLVDVIHASKLPKVRQ